MSILNKLNSAFDYKVYKVEECSINDVNCRKLLTEKQLSKMSRNEFRCYIKKYIMYKQNIDPMEIQLIKKIDRRIRNKETVRKLKMKTRNEFIVLKMEYEHLYYLYTKIMNQSKQYIKDIEACNCSIDVSAEKEQLSKLQYKYVDIEY